MGNVARIMTGVGSMICVAWFFATWESEKFPYDALTAFIPLFLSWLYFEASGTTKALEQAVPTLHPHDVELGQKLRGLIDERMKRYLRETSFGESFYYERLEPIRQLANEWTSAEYEFVNTELINLAGEVQRVCQEFDDQVFELAYPLDRDGWWSIIPDLERKSDWHSRETSLMVGRVNALASDIAEKADAFERGFRLLAPEAYAASLAA